LRGDFSRRTFEHHAALLGDRRMSHPMYARQRAEIVRQLQRDYGNQYVQRLAQHISHTRAEAVQTKLTVGPAGDKYEHEADLVAKEVMGTIWSSGSGAAQRQDLEEEEEELRLKPMAQRLADQISRMRAEGVQRKLTVGPAGDKYEREADAVAREVVRGIGSSESREERIQRIQDQTLAYVQHSRQRHQEAELARRQASEEQPQVGMEGGEVTPDLSSRIEGARGSGQALPDNVRTQMEQGFGADFSGVKVHTGPESNALNEHS